MYRKRYENAGQYGCRDERQSENRSTRHFRRHPNGKTAPPDSLTRRLSN
uniref:Uncharacterized protein n=1 Tax=Neisseria meningitidis alpha275 TaxID=295996 RepID=C6SHE6_NEIME|nr:hypothetical protein predicted by Glimmer/Critica [Neisseria meningitidis alpha275]